jgi:heat shock protein HtpX
MSLGVYKQINSNKQKTVFMLLIFAAFVGGIGYLFSRINHSPSILVMALVIGVGQALFSYFGASKAALAMNGAQQIQKRDDPRLYRTVENLSLSYGMPMPKVYVIEDQALNAFATGRDPDHAVVAATRGLLNVMTDKELEGVIAHELGHVKNYDIRVSMVAFGLVMVIGILCDMLLRMSFFGGGRDRDENSQAGSILIAFSLAAMIIAPFLATMLQLAISRKREHLADATGAHMTRYPEGLASALEKIRDGSSVMQRQNPSTAHFFFANPLKGKAFSALLSTHPPIEERIRILRQLDRVGA